MEHVIHCYCVHVYGLYSCTVETFTHAAMAADKKKEHVVFFHPDLGIGGAERLVIDAAVGLQTRGHRVTIFTSHCDPRPCFDEARDGELARCAFARYHLPPLISGKGR